MCLIRTIIASRNYYGPFYTFVMSRRSACVYKCVVCTNKQEQRLGLNAEQNGFVGWHLVALYYLCTTTVYRVCGTHNNTGVFKSQGICTHGSGAVRLTIIIMEQTEKKNNNVGNNKGERESCSFSHTRLQNTLICILSSLIPRSVELIEIYNIVNVVNIIVKRALI